MKKIIFILILLFFAQISFASILSFETEKNEFIVGEDILANVFLDTEENEINAVDIEIVLPESFSFKDYLLGDSIINFWVEKPHLIDNKIRFSGIIPGGYIGKKGKLITLILTKIKNEAGEEKISFSKKSQVLLNDGQGTPDKLKFEDLIIKTETGIARTFYEVKDNYPPEEFKPEIVNIEGLYYLIFETKDKQSGISHYEVSEKPGKFLIFKPKPDNFEIAESPYLLKDQTLRSYIFVKAIDRAGNERIEYLKPQNIFVFDEIIFIIIFAIIFFFILKKLIFYILKIK